MEYIGSGTSNILLILEHIGSWTPNKLPEDEMSGWKSRELLNPQVPENQHSSETIP